jgi:hypothetical protein
MNHVFKLSAFFVLIGTSISSASDRKAFSTSQSGEDHGLVAQISFGAWVNAETAAINYSLHVREAAPQDRLAIGQTAMVTVVFYDKGRNPLQKKCIGVVAITEEVASGTEGASCLSLVLIDVPPEAEYLSTFFELNDLGTGLIKLPTRPLD